MTTVHHRHCHLCEAMCGITVEVDGDRVVAIRGDDDDPLSRGHICPKAAAIADLHTDPDRLRAPLLKGDDGAWQEIGWDEALARAAAGIHAVQRAHGRDAVGTYLGNPPAHNLGAILGGYALFTELGTRNRYSAMSVDALPRVMVSWLLYGNSVLLPVPDLDRADLVVILGANPAVSNGSVMTAPGAARRLKDLRRRGGRLVVIDPRRTETADLADEHVFLRPETDAGLLLAMLHVLFAEGRVAPGRLADRIDGLDEVRELVAAFPPERMAPVTGVDAATIRRLALAIADAPRAVVYGRLGTCVQAFGALTTWLLDLVNLLTGNLDEPGGLLFGRPPIDAARGARLVGQAGTYDAYRSRVAGLPAFNGELPVAALADEIETPGDGQIRALVTVGGNPVLSNPNGRRLDRAFSGLDFMVAVDPYLNETTRHADLILPGCSSLETDNYPLLMQALAVRNFARLSPRVFEPPADARSDWQILWGLVEALHRHRSLPTRALTAPLRALVGRLGPLGLLDLGLRTGPYGDRFLPGSRGLSVARLREAPHGVDLGEREPRLPGLLATPGRRIHVAPALVTADVARFEAAAATPSTALSLISRRQLRSNNSWMHNSHRLMKGPDRCVLEVHPDDAAARGLADGDVAVIRSRIGEIQAPVRLTDRVMAGVICLPHGWGHDREGTRLSVASARPGVSINDVVDERRFDAVSGNSALSGTPVELERAAG